MSTVFSATHDCRGCGACLATCPERALRPAPPAWDVERCTGCGECMEICPADAFVEVAAGEAPWPA